MAGAHRLYPSLVRLYPSAFRREYGDDLVQHFADLAADRGARAAWARTSLDLAITIPRYHLERIMTEQHSAIAINITIGVLAAAGFASVMTGVGPGMVLIVAAVAFAVTQRTTLARALRVPDSELRHRRLRIGAILAGVFVISYVVYSLLIGDTWTVRETVLAIIGTLAMFGAIGFLVAGLLTPRTSDHTEVAQAR
ncbi:MAG: hypothetical protein ACT452_01270 [Microthrixaceae bacterium]